ncbi:retropepsin-like aspartic protease family protein [Pyruvatibacter mobilis]|uniref:retropepsin-like aspartic protease family protein n=1 Tax=Pyruvatibacter mobilis TaxID=1712261 RepID=UPI003BAED993
MYRNTWTWIGLAGLALSALVLFLASAYPDTLANEDAQMRLTYLVLLLVLVGSSVIVGWRQRAGLALKQALVWIAIGIVLIAAYSFRDEFRMLGHRLLGEVVPSAPLSDTPGQVALRASADGHFHVQALINGTNVRLLVDTGASDVALTASDARRLGIDPATLRFNRIYNTANGQVAGARVVLDEVTVGSLTVRDVAASVTQGDGLSQSLLGMSFLRELSAVQFDGDRLILRQ